jgi:carotenoid cleavage dioxygenase
MLQLRSVQKAGFMLLRKLSKPVPYGAHNTFLEGPFSPVREELTLKDLRVTGAIPTELDGLITRIGPNPVSVTNPAAHHWFRGDGMVHSLRLKDGQAIWYRNRYVGTDTANKVLGRPVLPGPRPGINDVVNTNVIRHGGSLWALVEAGAMPVEMDVELNTKKHGLFDSAMAQGFTAHPHLHPDTGELHGVCYDGLVHDHARYVIVGKDRQVRRNIRIPVKGPMIHDCAITKSHVLVLDLPVTFSWKALFSGVTVPYVWNPKRTARVGRLAHEGAAKDIRWFEVDPCFVFHTGNAYDLPNGDTVLDVVAHDRMFDGERQGPAVHKISFERWTLQHTTGRVARRVISEESQEFPRFDERLTGKPYRYAYTIGTGKTLHDVQPNSLFRHDLETGETIQRRFGGNWLSGEVVFVPRRKDAAEDEGWLLSYLHDVAGGNSRVMILDARNMLGEPVAVIELPVRVPLGFHGNWIAAAA